MMIKFLAFFYQFAVIFYLYMGIRVLRRQYNSTLNRVFFLLCATLAIWSFTIGFMIQSPDLETARTWRIFSTLGFCLMSAFFLHFFMFKTGFKPLINCTKCAYLLYIPGILYVFTAFLNPHVFHEGQYVLTSAGWTFLSSGNWLDWSYNVYYISYFIFGFILLARWKKTADKKREKNQATLIIISMIFAFTIGVLTDTFIPMLKVPVPPLAVIVAMIPASALWYTIEKYRYMGLSSQNIVSDILKNMGEGLLLLDVDGRIREVSDETLNLLACTREDLMMKPVNQIFLDEEKKRIPGLAEHETWQDIRNIEITLQRCDGKRLPVMFSTALIYDAWEEILGLICTFRDTRMLKAAEAKKNQALDRLNALMNTMQQGILFENDQGLIIYANPFFCHLFGLESPKAILGKRSLKLVETAKSAFVDPDAFVKGTKAHLAKRETILSEELNMKDGKILERDYIPVHSKNLSYGSYWIYRDITERKQSEKKIRSSLREKEILIAEIHHRVKNNLQLIISLVNMQQSAEKEDNAILNSVKSRIRAISLVHEKLFRIQNFEAIDFSGYLKNLVSHLAGTYKKPGLDIKTDIHVGNVVLPLEQATPCSLILNELISNAYKYGFTGEDSGLLKISFVKEKKGYKLTVSNNGMAIPAQALNSKAFGLGMKITQALVLQLKGKLEMDASRGTTFIVTFPKMDASEKQRF